ncbi:MAG: hypothetical protein ACE5FS_11775, partial [Paracoccaceae bacterium]
MVEALSAGKFKRCVGSGRGMSPGNGDRTAGIKNILRFKLPVRLKSVRGKVTAPTTGLRLPGLAQLRLPRG